MGFMVRERIGGLMNYERERFDYGENREKAKGIRHIHSALPTQ